MTHIKSVQCPFQKEENQVISAYKSDSGVTFVKRCKELLQCWTQTVPTSSKDLPLSKAEPISDAGGT